MCQIQAPVSALSPSNPLLALPVPAATHAPHDKHHATPMQYTYLGAQRGSRSSRAAGLWGSAGSARTPDQDCRVSRGKAERTHASQTHASREEHAPHEPGKLEHRLRHLSHLKLKHAKLVGAKSRVIDVERPIHRQLRRHARSHGARPGAGNSSQCHEVLNEYLPLLALAGPTVGNELRLGVRGHTLRYMTPVRASLARRGAHNCVRMIHKYVSRFAKNKSACQVTT